MSSQPPRFPPIGMSPGVWGPFFWTTMHIASLGYSRTPSQAEQDAAAQFYESLAYMIPCPICRSHYTEFLAEMPVRSAVQSRDALIEWVFTLHNRVNNRLGKPEITFAQYVEHMTALSQQATFSTRPAPVSWVVALCAGAALGVAAYAVYQTKK
jgi:hypothetical protein